MTNDMVDLLHSVRVYMPKCETKKELDGACKMAKKKLSNMLWNDALNSEQYESVRDYIVAIYKEELDKFWFW